VADIVDIEDLFGKVEGLEKPVRKKGFRRGPTGSKHDRGRLDRARRDAVIATMYAAEETLEDIAKEVGHIDASRVSQIIQGMIVKWRKLGLESISERQAKHLSGLDALEQELLAAWRESRLGRLVNVSERVKESIHNMHRRNRRNGKPSVSDPEAGQGKTANFKQKRYERLESSAGDPRYMALILDIRKERAKIWGLYAKDAGGGPGSGGYDPESLAQLDKGQLLARFMALVEATKMENARKLAQGVTIDISPRAMLTEGQPVANHVEDDSF
jgi:hypothetical protein